MSDAVLSLSVEAQQALATLGKVNAAQQQVGSSAVAMGGQIDAASKSVTTAVTRQSATTERYKMSSADLADMVARKTAREQDYQRKLVEGNAILKAYNDQFLALAQTEAIADDAAMNASKAHEGLTSKVEHGAAGMALFERSLGSMVGQMAGVPVVAERATIMLAKLAMGGPLVVAILIALAAMALAWKALTQEWDEAKKVVDDLTASLIKQYQASLNSASSNKALRGTELENKKAELAERNEELKFQSHNLVLLYQIGKLKREVELLDKAANMVDRAAAVEHLDNNRKNAQAIIQLIALGKADAGVMAQRKNTLDAYRTALDKLAPGDTRRAAILGDIKALETANYAAGISQTKALGDAKLDAAIAEATARHQTYVVLDLEYQKQRKHIEETYQASLRALDPKAKEIELQQLLTAKLEHEAAVRKAMLVDTRSLADLATRRAAAAAQAGTGESEVGTGPGGKQHGMTLQAAVTELLTRRQEEAVASTKAMIETEDALTAGRDEVYRATLALTHIDESAARQRKEDVAYRVWSNGILAESSKNLEAKIGTEIAAIKLRDGNAITSYEASRKAADELHKEQLQTAESAISLAQNLGLLSASLAGTLTAVVQLLSQIQKASELGGPGWSFGGGFRGPGSTTKNAAAGFAAGGIGAAIGTQYGGSALGGAALGGLSGATAGAAGGPIGIIVGGVIGMVGGLFGAAKKAAEAAEAMRKATKAFDLALDDFIAIAHPRGALGDALHQLKASLLSLQESIPKPEGSKYSSSNHGGRSQAQEEAQNAKQLAAELDAMNAAIAAGGNGRAARDYVAALLKIATAYEEAIAKYKAMALEEQTVFNASLAVRQANLQGERDYAETVALNESHRAEMAAALAAWSDEMDDATKAIFRNNIALLGQIQAQEEAALAAAQAVRSRRALEDLGIRGITATQGAGAGSEAAFALGQQREAEDALTEHRSLAYRTALTLVLAEEKLTHDRAVALTALRDIHSLEVRLAGARVGGGKAADDMAFANKQADEWEDALVAHRSEAYMATLRLTLAEEKLARGRAIAEVSTQAYASLAVRNAVALGGAGAALLAFTEQQRQEMAAAVEAGNAAYISSLQYTQGLEREKFVRDAATAAAARYADAIQSLTERTLRAAGLATAADESSILAQNAKDVKALLDAGGTQADVDQLRKDFATEAANRKQATLDAQQRAYDDAAKANAGALQTTRPDSGTSTNLSVGISESLAGRIVAIENAMYVLQAQYLPHLARLPRIQAALEAMSGLGGGLSLAEIDQGLGTLGVATARATGTNPSNLN